MSTIVIFQNEFTFSIEDFKTQIMLNQINLNVFFIFVVRFNVFVSMQL